jgi:hypothetical protein
VRIGIVIASVALAWSLTCAQPAVAAPQQSEPTEAAQAQAADQSKAGEAKAAKRASPWLLVPVVSSNPKLGTVFGGFGAYLRTFDAGSRVSLFGVTYQYTTTHSTVAGAFARTSFGADHHRIVGLAVFGYIKNDYEDYLGSGQPLKTNDDMKAALGRYLYRFKGNWFIGAQGSAANYQVLGETAQDDMALEALGVQGFKSAALGAVVLHDSRDGDDMPTRGWLFNVNNLAYREGLGGASSFDAYRADLRAFWKHGGGHVLAFRQYNWITSNAPASAQASIVLRGYKIGEYLSQDMSSFEVEERISLHRRWGLTLFTGVAGLYGEAVVAATRTYYPMAGGGIHFVIKPEQRMLVNFEYAQGAEHNHGLFLKFGYGW